MNFFQISLTSKCNFNCWHCPMANYRNKDEEKYKLTNNRLIPWILRNLDPSEWVIELTGGEPSLYEGIDELVYDLSYANYIGLVKTNGSLPIIKTNGFKRVAAFHKLNEPPRYFDEILIIDKIDSKEKELICKKNNWKYKIIGKDNENPDYAQHKFKLIGFMDPHGHPTPCKSYPVNWEYGVDKYTLEFTELKTNLCCPNCKAAIDAWRFLPEELKLNRSI